MDKILCKAEWYAIQPYYIGQIFYLFGHIEVMYNRGCYNMTSDIMSGKEKCAYMKQLRIELAEKYNIPYEPKICSYKGNNCLGTCKVCDEELKYLTKKILGG